MQSITRRYMGAKRDKQGIRGDIDNDGEREMESKK